MAGLFLLGGKEPYWQEWLMQTPPSYLPKNVPSFGGTEHPHFTSYFSLVGKLGLKSSGFKP